MGQVNLNFREQSCFTTHTVIHFYLCPNSISSKFNLYSIFICVPTQFHTNSICTPFLFVPQLNFDLSVHCPIAWSDKALFAIFEKGDYAADQIYFYDLNFFKIGEFIQTRQGFHSQKITGTLKINIFFFLVL